MRSLDLYIACSLDGYIADAEGGVDWLFTDQDYGFKEFYEAVDVVLMGRLTWEKALSFGDWPYQGKRSLVFSSTHVGETNEDVEFVSGELTKVLEELSLEDEDRTWLVGGGHLIRSCLEDDLVERFHLFVHPVLLGEGLPLFPGPFPRRRLRLDSCRAYDSGLVELRYVRSETTPVGEEEGPR
jgi:dihydrofolate reductase